MLSLGMAVMGAPSAQAQTPSEDLRRLQEENAALRRQLEEFQRRFGDVAPSATPRESAPATAATPRTATEPVLTEPVVPPSRLTDEDVITLSAFDVRSERDFGYLATNSLTATRIGARIQDTPLQIQVISEDFIKDTAMNDIQDVLRYTATAAGDNQMGILQPATGFTPSGRISMRGFPINARMRNNVRRYTLYSMDNVERVELIRGPAAVFFGQSFPGGVINYVTKRAEFNDIPATGTYRFADPASHKVTYDDNRVVNDKVAIRNFFAWENSTGQRDHEFRHGFTINPSANLKINDWLQLRGDVEFSRRNENMDASTGMWPQQWFDDYANPPAALMATRGLDPSNPADVATYRARIANQGLGNWIADVRAAANDQGIPLYTDFRKGEVASRLSPRDFNVHGYGSLAEHDVTNVNLTFDITPFDWLATRVTWNKAKAYYFERKAQARPNADGFTYNTLVGLTWRHYQISTDDYMIDNVFKLDVGGFKNKFLVGGIYRKNDNQFGGAYPTNTPDYSLIPGAGGFTDQNGTGGSPLPGGTATALRLQALKDRNGNLMTAQQVFSHYDPELHPYPDIAMITKRDRHLIDRYRPRSAEWYVNYQGSMLDDRLHLMAGYREEKTYNRQQVMRANPPWSDSFEDMLDVLNPAQYPQYEISESYQRSLLGTLTGDALMYGAVYQIKPDLSVYFSNSQSYLPNGGFRAIYNEADVRTRAIALGRNPDTEVARIRAEGSDDILGNEEGTNMEVGLKTSFNDGKITSTFALFRLERTNRRVDDGPRQNDEPLNYDANGVRTGNIVRWFSAEATQRTEGTEFEVIWSPNRNYQAIMSASWMWTAKTVADPSILPNNVNYDAIFNGRLENAPEYTFNFFNKYTFGEGNLEGLTIGGGLRYSSEIVISASRDWNARRGGLTAGDYIVVDALIGYPIRILDMPATLNLSVNNLFDSTFSEGGWNLAPRRQFYLSTGVRF
jgi:outer membrane receptor protein involved in Fe transport